MSQYFISAVGDTTTEVRFLAASLNDSIAAEIGEQLGALAAGVGAGTLRLDFARIGFLSSVAIGQLIRLKKQVAAAGGQLLVVNLNPELQQLFRVTRLDKFLESEM